MDQKNIKKTVAMSYEDTFVVEDFENRRLYLNYPITEESLDHIAYHIMRYNREDKGKDTKERKPIVVYINSPGGCVSDGLGIIDAIITSKTPVYTVNQAMCASMGFLIYIAGHKRFSMPHAEFLMHDGSTWVADSSAKARDRIEFETGQLEKVIKDYVLAQTSISEELYDEKHRVEWYFLPTEAKKIGVCHHIIGTDCELEDVL